MSQAKNTLCKFLCGWSDKMEWLFEMSIGYIPNHTRVAAATGLLVQAFIWSYLYFSKRNALKGSFPVLVFALFALADFTLKSILLTHSQAHGWTKLVYFAVTFLSIGVVLHAWGMIKVCRVFYTPKQLNKEMDDLKNKLALFQQAMIQTNRFDGLTKQFMDLHHSFVKLEDVLNANETTRRDTYVPDAWPDSDGSDSGLHPKP